MGKRKRGGGKHRRGGKKKRTEWQTIVYENKDFENYYKGQKVIPEDQWEAFVKTMKEPLPITFRVSTYDGMYIHVQKKLMEKDFFGGVDFKSVDKAYQPIERPGHLPWYKNGMGWYFKLGRKDLKRVPQLLPFRKWLVTVTDNGTVFRQEAVSMLPPLLLDVQPHHYVLDMCAAPGSKTCQLIEALHSQGATTMPKGLVIANDADQKRAFMLTKQIKRLRSPCFLVSNHRAQFFPSLFHSNDEEKSQKQDERKIYFDRILADVPCSGDGTMRKNAIIWNDWTLNGGLGLHSLQYQIAFRGINMLKPGGRMVYSTCSLNPIENEAVVAQLLRVSDGGMKLVDAHGILNNLKAIRGMLSWRVMSKDREWIESYDKVPENMKRKLHASMFPPSAAEAKEFHLEYCMRLLPHLQDTGGFFVAILERTNKPFPAARKRLEKAANAMKVEKTAEKGKEEKKEKETGKENEKDGGKKKPVGAGGDDPFQQLDPKRADLIAEFYGLPKEETRSSLFQRSEIGKRISLLNPAVADIVRNPENSRLRVIHSGLRAFELTQSFPRDTYTRDRITQDGVLSLVNVMKKRKVEIDVRDVLSLFADTTVAIEKFVDVELKENLAKMESGSILLVLRDKGNIVSKEKVAIAAWKTPRNISIMCAPTERQAYKYAIAEGYPQLKIDATKAPNKTNPGLLKKSNPNKEGEEKEKKEPVKGTE